mmetsp:Transcript_39314/g.93125  ORF Transcript_39314/g.93125 Transcript_39314/m.93125 type:complete len:280 (-) Transcript_39314:44-883(-)
MAGRARFRLAAGPSLASGPPQPLLSDWRCGRPASATSVFGGGASASGGPSPGPTPGSPCATAGGSGFGPCASLVRAGSRHRARRAATSLARSRRISSAARSTSLRASSSRPTPCCESRSSIGSPRLRRTFSSWASREALLWLSSSACSRTSDSRTSMFCSSDLVSSSCFCSLLSRVASPPLGAHEAAAGRAPLASAGACTAPVPCVCGAWRGGESCGESCGDASASPRVAARSAEGGRPRGVGRPGGGGGGSRTRVWNAQPGEPSSCALRGAPSAVPRC